MDLIVVYITCSDNNEAQKLLSILMEKRLCACGNIINNADSKAFWPPETSKIESSNESILIVKTIENNFLKVESTVKENHSYKLPCILGWKLDFVSEEYKNWVLNEINQKD